MARANIECLDVGALSTCCYLIYADEEDSCTVIDPGGDEEMILNAIREKGKTLGLILLTHSHYDHIGAVNELKAEYPDATLCCHPECAKRSADPTQNLSLALGRRYSAQSPDRTLEKDDSIKNGGIEFKVDFIPGHAPGHLTYEIEEDHVIFAGDVIFNCGIGRSDLPGGSEQILKDGINRLLERLPADTVIYPGHGPSTTAGQEKETNPFLC